MACRFPPRDKESVKSERSLGSTRQTLLLLGILGLGIFWFLPGNSFPTPQGIQNPPSVEEPEFLNFYGEPELTHMLWVDNSTIYAASSNGLYHINISDGSKNFLSNVGLQDAPIVAMAYSHKLQWLVVGGTGLAIYDTNSSRTHTFGLTEGLAVLDIADLALDTENGYVIFTHGQHHPGVGVLDLTTFSISYYLSYDSVADMYFEQIMVCPGQGYYLYNNQSFMNHALYKFQTNDWSLTSQRTSFVSNVNPNQVKSVAAPFTSGLVVDEKGLLVLADENRQIHLWDVGSQSSALVAEDLILDRGRINSIKQLNDTHLLLGFGRSALQDSQLPLSPLSHNGGIALMRISTDPWVVQKGLLSNLPSPYFMDKEINTILLQNESYAMLGTSRGLYSFEMSGEKGNLYQLGSGISANSVKAVSYSDTSKLLYVGSEQELYTYQPESEELKKFTGTLDQYASPYITSLSSSLGYVFVGTWGSGLYILNENTGDIRQKTFWDGLQGSYVRALTYEPRTDTLYIAHESGVSTYSVLTQQFSQLPLGDTDTTVDSLALNMKTGHLFIGVKDKVLQWDPLTEMLEEIVLQGPDSNAGAIITSLAVDPFNDKLYYGTTEGLAVYNLAKQTVERLWDVGDGMGSNSVESLVSDGYRLYIGTKNGLSIKNLEQG